MNDLIRHEESAYLVLHQHAMERIEVVSIPLRVRWVCTAVAIASSLAC
jgi:hypothetical protein